MPDLPDISVIIVSRDRPCELQKMLACLRLQDISGFETIVVTNTPGALEGALTPSPLRLFDSDEANIPVSRNVGLAAAQGRYVAFCDDDALPDPSWLRRLLAPFSSSEIGGAGGYTRGRNGISLQWSAVKTNVLGEARPLEIDPDRDFTVFAPSGNTAPVMIGTNCAFRASALRQIGGFDPAFAYFLDDSDISLRLSQAGWKLAIVPAAQVHHGFAAGPYRQQNRVPRTLKPHGKSMAVFGRKHAAERLREPALERYKSLQSKRLEKQMLAGLMEPAALPKLLESLEQGYNQGRHFLLRRQMDSPRPKAGLAPGFADVHRPHIMLAGRKSNKGWMLDLAKKLVAEQAVVTALTLSRSVAYMQVGFSKHGFWQHEGGQFGKSNREEPVFQRHGLRQKARAEARRLQDIRPVSYLVFPDRTDKNDIILPQTDVMHFLNEFSVESV